jgi:hypothetical protein
MSTWDKKVPVLILLGLNLLRQICSNRWGKNIPLGAKQPSQMRQMPHVRKYFFSG